MLVKMTTSADISVSKALVTCCRTGFGFSRVVDLEGHRENKTYDCLACVKRIVKYL